MTLIKCAFAAATDAGSTPFLLRVAFAKSKRPAAAVAAAGLGFDEANPFVTMTGVALVAPSGAGVAAGRGSGTGSAPG